MSGMGSEIIRSASAIPNDLCGNPADGTEPQVFEPSGHWPGWSFCALSSEADVRITAAGYYVISIKETIPFSEATPSPTGTYWRCQWGGSRKCFFAPPSQT